ncbi:MAG: metallophosphoesterase [Proteobacteria bacterium]|nr:metallophosphoesterase [Pseudomonadota bacterium]
MSRLTWLHLSDIHLPGVSSDTYQVDKVLKALINTLKKEAAKGEKPDVIFITGDIADKGGDYSKAEQFFDELLDATGLLERAGTDAKQRLFIVPGNHDVDRNKASQKKFLLRTLQNPETAIEFFAPQSVNERKSHFERFHKYQEFFNRYFEGVREFNVERHYYAEVIDLKDIPIRLGVIGLNSAWFSEDEEDEHKLWIGERVCEEAFNLFANEGAVDLKIVLYHHPLSWLHQKDKVKGILSHYADICLYGHIHCDETEQTIDQHGGVLNFQAGATYEKSDHPHRALWGTVNLETGKVQITPITYQEGPEPWWTVDPSLFPKRGPHYTKDFDLYGWIQRKTLGLPPCDPIAFYSGGSANQADIAASLDVPRTQYVKTWTDENGVPQKAWKDLLFTQAEETISEKRVRLVILYGHRGSGKTTLCKRMVHDLNESLIPAIDFLTIPLASEHVDTIQAQMRAAHEKCLHVFTKIEDIQKVIVVQQFLATIRRLIDAQVALIVYIAIDTNMWKQIEDKIGNFAHTMGCRLESRHLRGQLDEQEVEDIISRLKDHHCLFCLEHKTDEAINSLFRRKAKRALLTCLIEATRGTEEGQGLAEILWYEYQSLGNKAKWAYALVTLFGAFGIVVPYSIMEGVLKELTGDSGYFASTDFSAETAEIIVYRPMSASYTVRLRLVAETLLKRLIGEDGDGFNYRLLSATLRSLDFSIPLHRTFFKMALDRKVLLVIPYLEQLIQDVKERRIGIIQNHDISRVLNSIIRIYQDRGEYEKGKLLADESLKHWNHIGNKASYLRAFCCYYLGETEEVRKAAESLVKTIDHPFQVLRGIALLRMLRDWTAADEYLKDFEKSVGSDIVSYPDYDRLRRQVDLGLKVNWGDSDLDSLRPSVALDRIECMLVSSGADETAICEQYKRLIRRQHNFFQGYLSFFSYLHRPRGDEDEDVMLERYRVLQHECEYHLDQHEGHYKNYPKDVRSLLHSNLARALFKIDYISIQGYKHQEACATHFQKAIGLKRENWYAHNWCGTFLKEAIKDRETAKTHYELAVKGDKNNPVFKNNLALLYYEAPTFSREGLKKAQELAQEAQSLCIIGSYWEDFYHYPNELLLRINLLLERTDLRDEVLLDADEALPADVE